VRSSLVALLAALVAVIGTAGTSLSATRPPLVGGIRITAPPHDVLAGCRHARAVLRFLIPCPSALPAGWSTAVPMCPNRNCRAQFSVTAYFPGPPGYIGEGVRSGRMNLWALAAARRAEAGLGCPGIRGSGYTTVSGHTATWFACPGGSQLDSGHLLLQWQSHGIDYGVSAHGHSRTNRLLVLYIARHLRLLRPR
jgi:hypothetical protein